MVKSTANRALSATTIPEQFDLPGATSNGGAGPLLDYALDVRRLGGAASFLFDALKANNAKYSGGFSVALMILLRPLGYLRPLDFDAAAHDPYLSKKIGADRLPDASTVSRDLHRLKGEGERDKLRELHRQMLKPALLAEGPPSYVILDGDSSVEVVYGDHLEGAARGYNPRARGRKSYHPLIFSDGVRDLVINAWLRHGNVGDSWGFLEHYRGTRDYLASIGRPIIAVRLDRGFRGEVVYVELETDETDYAIKAAETKRIREAKQDIEYEEITCEGDCEQIEVSEIVVKLSGWSRSRRVVIVRRRQRDPDQLWLLDWGWRYECIVTNMGWSPEDVWRFYNQRCQAENLIKELKQGFGIDMLSTGSFGANDADLVLKVISHTLVWGFRHDVLPSEWRPFTIRTLRNALLRIPGVLRTHSGQWYIRLASWYAHQEAFAGIRRRVDAMALVT